MEVYTQNIDNVDAWDIYYEVGTDDFYVYDKSTEITWQPVWMYDEVGYPSDFVGWNQSE